MGELVHIVPVPGNWLPGVPAAEADVDEDAARALVATGAFEIREEKPPKPSVRAEAGLASATGTAPED